MSRLVKNIILMGIMLLCYIFCFSVFSYADSHLVETTSSTEHIVYDGVEYESEGDSTRKFTPTYHIIFLIKCMICDIFLVYLFLSGFNKKTYRETFEYKKKYAVYFVSYFSFVVIDFTMTILFGYIYINIGNQLSYSDYDFVRNEEKLIYRGEYVVDEEYDEQRRTLSSDDDEEVTLLFEGEFNATLLAHSITKNGNGDSFSIGRNAGIAFRRGVIGDLTNVIVKTSGVYSPAIFVEGSSVDMRRSTLTTENENSPVAYVYGNLDISNVTFTSEKSYVFRLVNDAVVTAKTCNISSNDLNNLKNIYITGSNFKKSDKNYENHANTKATLSISNASFVSSGGDLVSVENNYFDVLFQSAGIVGNNGNGFRNILTANNGNGIFTLDNQMLNGGISLENESVVNLVLTGESTFIGRATKDDTSSLNVKLSENSKIILTGDMFINSLDNENPVNANIITNGFAVYLNGNQIL